MSGLAFNLKCGASHPGGEPLLSAWLMAPEEQQRTPSITAMLLWMLHKRVCTNTSPHSCMRNTHVHNGDLTRNHMHDAWSFEISALLGWVDHVRGEHTSCVSCQDLSAVIGSIPSLLCSSISWRGSHLLPFALSVKPLILSIHLKK